ncbi:hypothetical protein [Rhodophyticola sp.]|uniref:hypothetical protein n=1 Tax=Rhodophyticola sp. TaxID=2680032 RepID=UPI003D2DEA18
MSTLEDLAKNDPKKLEELAAFHWFSVAAGIKYDQLYSTERPDFIFAQDGKTIGVEVTCSHRPVEGRFQAQQIEEAQCEFATTLYERVKPKLPIDIGLILEDNVPVDKRLLNAALEEIIARIEEVSETMEPHSVVLLVRSESDLEHSRQRKVICPEIPSFLQHIQLFNDGHKKTLVTGSRGCIVENFTDADLTPILERKHKALAGYRPCDEHWLLVAFGVIPAILLPNERPDTMIATISKSYGDIKISRPVQSDFDRVYLFKGPSEVVLITE